MALAIDDNIGLSKCYQQDPKWLEEDTCPSEYPQKVVRVNVIETLSYIQQLEGE